MMEVLNLDLRAWWTLEMSEEFRRSPGHLVSTFAARAYQSLILSAYYEWSLQIYV